MGEAKRRKHAGHIPAGPVEDFRAPAGTIAITFDVKGASPSTCLLDAAHLMDAMAEVEKLAATMDYYRTVRFIAAEFLKAKRTGGQAAFQWVGPFALWTALHHPKLGRSMRDGVSEQLRRDGKSHLTWQFDPAVGLAMALAERFVDLETIAARMPANAMFEYCNPAEPRSKPS